MRILRNERDADTCHFCEAGSATVRGQDAITKTTTMQDETKELATVLGNVRTLSDKTNEEQNGYRWTSPDQRVRDELRRIYDEVHMCLAAKLKPCGIEVVQVTVQSLVPKDAGKAAEQLARIVPEVKVGTTEDPTGIPDWLRGNLCD